MSWCTDSLINKRIEFWNVVEFVTERLRNNFPARFAFNQAYVRTESIRKNAIVLCMNQAVELFEVFGIDPFFVRVIDEEG